MNQSAFALGVFDGLHKGHQEIFNVLKAVPCKQKIVLIFDPHPRKVLSNTDIEYIMPLEIRISEVKKLGFENVLIWQFSQEFAQTHGEEFIKNVLIKQYGCKHLVVGFNAHFGKGRDVTPDTLPRISRSTHINVTICASEVYKGIPISSTRIREEIKKGELHDVSCMLGKDFFIEGKVIKGVGLGKKIGFPTINVKYRDEQVLPPVGVYFGYMVGRTDCRVGRTNCHNNNFHPAMINLGYRPTVESQISRLKTQNFQRPILEFYIVDESMNAAPDNVRITFVERIRDEKKFNSIEELQQQLEKDKMYVMKKFINNKIINSKE